MSYCVGIELTVFHFPFHPSFTLFSRFMILISILYLPCVFVCLCVRVCVWNLSSHYLLEAFPPPFNFIVSASMYPLFWCFGLESVYDVGTIKLFFIVHDTVQNVLCSLRRA